MTLSYDSSMTKNDQKMMLIHKNRNFPAKIPSFDIFSFPLMKHNSSLHDILDQKIKFNLRHLSVPCQLELFR